MESLLDVFAPFDDELNPCPEEAKTVEPVERLQVKTRETNQVRRRSRWEPVAALPTQQVEPPQQKKPAAQEKAGLPAVLAPAHWQDISNVGMNSGMPASSLSRMLVQKILFADACCGTSTSNFMLDKVLNL